MIAHNNIAGVGREKDWATHDIEHTGNVLSEFAA